jgi:hypothetical protein
VRFVTALEALLDKVSIIAGTSPGSVHSPCLHNCNAHSAVCPQTKAPFVRDCLAT